MNFGTLKDIFVQELIESYVSGNNKGKYLYKNFLKILKENETLKTAFIVYKNIEDKTIKSETSANEYLKESISLLENFRGDKSLSVQSKKLVNLLKENGINVNDFKTKELHESIQNLITKKKSISTIDSLHESRSNVISWLMSDKEQISESKDQTYVKENIDLKKFLEIAVSKFNEKYGDSLNEEEKNILKVLRENDKESLKDLVESLINENIELINENLENYYENISVKEKLLNAKDVIYRMRENDDSFSEKILKLYDLKNDLK